MRFNLNVIKIGWFLGWRQLIRSSKWSNILIVAIMILTFLNLVVVSGLLVGIIEGAVTAAKRNYTGDLIITSVQEKDYVENSFNILSNLDIIDGIDAISPRYLTSAEVESNYKNRTNFEEKKNSVRATVAGIDPESEDSVTNISNLLIEGSFLEKDDFDEVLVGSMLLRRYFDLDSSEFLVLDDVFIGTKLLLTLNGQSREVRVKGILKSKVDEIDRRIFMTDSQLRNMIGRSDLNVSEIAVLIGKNNTPNNVKKILLDNGFGENAKIQTFEDAQPKFLQDMKDTFTLLGNIISSIGLVVAAITIFIVIFINAITRRKYIGIMKGIGVSGIAIELSYVFQSLIYALIGSVIGLGLVYLFLIPYVQANPINFPFSDGILVAPLWDTIGKVTLLITTTVLAGYIPARMIVQKNTLDSILGRN